MFSPSLNGTTASTPAANTRGRRRQRPLSTDSLAQPPKAKRQRIPLTEQTFVNPDSTPAPGAYDVKPTTPSMVEIKQDGIENMLVPKRELSVRSKKPKPSDRISKGDGSVVLTSNNAYTASKLPALPDRLRVDATARQHGVIDTSNGYALSLTHTHAIVWPYSASIASPESFVFTLPYPSKHASEPLPVGALVAPSASSSEPGLIVVMPASGKITYWESISSATTFDFMRQQRNGVEDSIPGMFSGETVIQIVNAESASGFILTFSSGRLAYLSVRDGHGRPQVAVHFLRSSISQTGGGFLGSIRHALSHSAVSGDIAAVRSDRSSRQGECALVAATSKGKLYGYKVHRGGHNDLLTEVDARDDLTRAIHDADRVSREFSSESLKIVDFTFVPNVEVKHSELTQLMPTPEATDKQHLLLLVSLVNKRKTYYALVEVILGNKEGHEDRLLIGMVRPIKSYTSPPDSHALTKPRIYLPRPSVVAFLVFDRAIVVASVAKPPESPDSQLMSDAHVLPSTYEDVIDLRENPTIEVVGSGFEEPFAFSPNAEEPRLHRNKSKNPAVFLLVRGVGILRITTTDVERFASETPPKVTPKSKLEQAVFFGLKEDNPLVFDVKHDLQFNDKELGKAAIALSLDILSSRSSFLSTVPAHLENSMRIRVQALQKLMHHLKTLQVDLDRQTRWQLLWNAEKMQVATFLWKRHEDFAAARPADHKKTILAEVVEYIRAEEKTEPDPSIGEVDPLRHWFIHDTHRMDLFIAWAYQVIKHNNKAGMETQSLARFIMEAVEVNCAAMHGALDFRRKNLTLYGLAKEPIENGILLNGYEGISPPWTGSLYLAHNLKRLHELAYSFIVEFWPPQGQTQSDAPSQDLIERTRQNLPALTAAYLTTLQEQFRASLASEDPKVQQQGQGFEETYNTDRFEKIVQLTDFELFDEATDIAEKHRCLDALAAITTNQLQNYQIKLLTPDLRGAEITEVKSKNAAKEKELMWYFDKYGKEFAFAFYEGLMSHRGVEAVLDFIGDKHGYATEFLRQRPHLAKVSWINDIEREKDIDHAAATLLDLGLVKEQQIWNKKIELSLGKLARLAEPTAKPSRDTIQDAQSIVKEAQLDKIDNELAIIKVQDQLYGQMFPVVSVALDESEEVGVAMESFSIQVPKKYKILHTIYENALSRLLKHEVLDARTLIDLLTLITLKPENKMAIPDQFFLAIHVAHCALTGEQRNQAERLIWRRCYIRDEWTKINNTQLKNDKDVVDKLCDTGLYDTFSAVQAYEQKPGDAKGYKIVLPSEALGVYTEDLDPRWTKSGKNDREKLLEAMRWEDSNLKKHIEKHRLDNWAQTTKDLARNAINAALDEATIAGASTNGTQPRGEYLNGTNGSNGGAH